MQIKFLLRNKASYLFFAIAIAFTLYHLYQAFDGFLNGSSHVVIKNLLIAIIAGLIVGLMFLAGVLSNQIIVFSKRRTSKLKKRMVIAFSIGAALPTIIVALFSSYFFSLGIESWFDHKITKILSQSVNVGQSYLEENRIQLKDTTISVANDLNAMYYDLVDNKKIFNKVLNAQAQLRSFDEAIVFEGSSHNSLAQTRLSVSLAYSNVSSDALEKARLGEVVELDAGDTKIRYLIKLSDFNDSFLVVGRIVDPKIIRHIDKTNGAVAEYYTLRNRINIMQTTFTLIFIVLSLVLLTTAIFWGRKFASKIVAPITELVRAAERVKNGDLTAQVPMEKMRQDEIKVLSSAFNRMVNQLQAQQKELIVAQRALAWSDVARRVAHEIKNPLTPIQLSAERINSKFSQQVNDKETLAKYTNNILKHSNDIKNIVSEFSDFARLPAPNFANYEICSLIRDSVESRKLINNTINYLFETNIEQCDVVCDISQINRVLVNLLLNAEEALEHKVGEKIIKITLSLNDNEVILKIIDNGGGFSNEMLSKATQAYITTKEKGTGLGLSIVDRIITDHFGELIISNNEQYQGGQVTLKFDLMALKQKI